MKQFNINIAYKVYNYFIFFIRLKDLESKLAERDAMIKVLQKHTYDKDVSSMLGRSPHHTPHPSLGGPDIDHVLGSTVSREELGMYLLNLPLCYFMYFLIQ